MNNKIPKRKKIEARCKNTFKNPDNIGVPFNKLWAEVICTIENRRNAYYNEDTQRHTYPNSNEVEVSGE